MGLKKELTRKLGRCYRVVFLVALLISFALEVMFFFEYQAGFALSKLQNDFKIILTLKENTSASQIDSISDALKSNKQIVSVKLITAQESLDFLKSEDARLALDIRTLGLNFLPDFLEIKPSVFALVDGENWIEKNILSRFSQISDAFYNNEQGFVILHLYFYEKFLMLTLAMIAFLLVLLLFLVEFYKIKKNSFLVSVKQGSGWIFSGVLASSISVFLVWIFTVLLKNINPDWFYGASIYTHLIVIFSGAILGWILFRWKNA